MAFLYSLDDDAGGAFTVDPNTGTLTVASPSYVGVGQAFRITWRAVDTTGAQPPFIRTELIGVTAGAPTPDPVSLSGALPGAGRLAGALVVANPIALTGNISGSGSLSGALANASPVSLMGGILGASALSGALTVAAAGTSPLTGAIPGSGALTGALTVTAASGLVQARKGRIAAAMAA